MLHWPIGSDAQSLPANSAVETATVVTVAICFKGNDDLNRWMVANGWAVAYRRYSVDYVADEDAARQSRINIWSGDFDMPWDWRARRPNR
jgi:endonuclease YncB( thermonuclease family)